MLLFAARCIGRMRFLPFGLRDRALRLLVPPQRQRDHAFVCNVGAARYAGNLNNYIDWSIYFRGQYERYLLTFIARVLPLLGPRPVFWDIGANSGQHALFAAGLGARVEAFEPFAKVRDKLRRSLALNPDFDLRVHPFGLGSVSGDFAFVPPDDENLGTGHFIATGLSGGDVLSLPIRRGDDIDALPPALIKIDVEGFEGDVLRGLVRTIAAVRPIIVCEFSARTKARDADLRLLVPERYNTLLIRGVERPHLTAYTGAGNGEIILFLPEEKTSLVAAQHRTY